ncbi:MAG: hypothetical protein M3O30_00505 [Planctomycetota bacterium]|nr:hypothetical protein [Planctomycetota bacterium]
MQFQLTVRLRILFALLFSLTLPLHNIAADAPATQPTGDDPLIPAAAVPSYLSIGKGLALQLRLVRQTVDDLKLPAPTGTTADAMVDQCISDLNRVITQLKSGNLPSNSSVMAVPGKLRESRAKLYDFLGPDQSKLLDERMQSLRGQARLKIGELRLMLQDLKLTNDQQHRLSNVLSTTDASVEQLPATDVQGTEYDKARAQMNEIFAEVHDCVAAILSPDEQTELGPRFAQLARATTAPSGSGT